MRYLIIGNGKTAYHMRFYLNILGYEVLNWHYRPALLKLARISETTDSNPSSKLIDAESPQIPSDPQSLRLFYDRCDRILLLIRDAAIDSFLTQYPFLRTSKTIHFSGALQVEGISNLHPLISFSEDLFAPEFYPQIPFALFSKKAVGVAKNTETSNTTIDESNLLAEWLPGFTNPWFVIPFEQKSLYHGLCVAGGNLMVLLWQAVGREFSQHFQIDESILFPYLKSITANLLTHWNQALTGPIARRDEITLNKNYVSLKETPLKPIFEAHVTSAWPEFAQKHFHTSLDQPHQSKKPTINTSFIRDIEL